MDEDLKSRNKILNLSTLNLQSKARVLIKKIYLLFKNLKKNLIPKKTPRVMRLFQWYRKRIKKQSKRDK